MKYDVFKLFHVHSNSSASARRLKGAALTLAVLIALPVAGSVYAADDTHFYSVDSTDQTAGNYNNNGAKGKNAIAAGVGAVAQGTSSIAVGDTARVLSNGVDLTSIAVGENAYVLNGSGQQEYMLSFDRDNWTVTPSGFFSNTYTPKDVSHIAGGIAIGTNTFARTGSIQLGSHTYTGTMGGIDVTDKTNGEANIVDMTTIGTNSYNKGVFSNIYGAYSIATGDFDGSGGFNSLLYGSQNFGANMIGSLNSNRSKGYSGYSGIANSIVGIANVAENSNGTLIYGAGNKVTNSIRAISGVSDLGGTVDGAAEKLRTAVQDSNSGGATMVFGGGNTADYTLQSQILGINSTLKGSKGNESTNNFLDGVGNVGTNIQNTTIIGTANTAKDSNHNVVIGDNHYIDGNSNNVIIGSSDTANTQTNATGAVILGHNANASVDGGVALGEDSQATVDKGQTGYDPGTGNTSAKADSTWKSTAAAVSVGDVDNGITRQITSVAAGTQDTDAVNVAQLKAATTEVQGSTGVKVTKTYGTDGHAVYTVAGAYTAGDNISIDKNGKISAQFTDTTYSAGDGITIDSQKANAISVKAADNGGLSVDSKGVAVNAGQGIEIKNNKVTAKLDGSNLTLSDNGIGLNNNIDLTKNGSVTVGDTTVNNNGVTIAGGPSVTKSGIDGGSQKITNVAAGTADTDAVNVSQLNGAVTNITNKFDGAVNRIDNRINKVGAGAAALAALHPADFDPDDKWDFTAGYGNYRGANAAAVGLFYRPSEDVMISVGGTLGNGENMVNAGVSIKLGQGNHVSTSRVAIGKELEKLRSIVIKQDEQIQKLTAMVNTLTGSVLPVDKTKAATGISSTPWAYNEARVVTIAKDRNGNPIIERVRVNKPNKA
jgi:hypothetical protein